MEGNYARKKHSFIPFGKNSSCQRSRVLPVVTFSDPIKNRHQGIQILCPQEYISERSMLSVGPVAPQEGSTSMYIMQSLSPPHTRTIPRTTEHPRV